jgi:hypothetical protein
MKSQYRDLAPAYIDDNKLRALMKEHRNNKDKINETITGWWESAESKTVVEVEEQWVTTTKAKKPISNNNNANQPENQGASDRSSGGGRGRTRAAPAAGRGAGRDAGRGSTSGVRSSASIRDNNDEQATPSATTKAESSSQEPTAAVAPTSSKGNAWGKKSTKSEASTSQAVAESKAAPEPVRTLPVPNLPADSLWNSVETAAQRIKRIEREKNQPPPPPPTAETTPAPADVSEKVPKKRRERTKKGEKASASVPTAEATVNGDAEAAPVTETTSLLENLAIDAPPAAPVVESPPSPAKVKASTSGDVEGSPKIGLKMGKWENKSERIDGPSLSFGSFGNATSLVPEESSTASASWGAAASDSSAADVPVSGGAVWSNGQQADASNSSNNGNQTGPPGLGSGKPQRSAPGQSRNKNENQQNMQPAQNIYQQPPGFGAPGSRGAPITNMAIPYGQPYNPEYMHLQFQAPTAGIAPVAGSTANAGAANMLNPAIPQPQQLQQAYAQPPGMAAPQFYNQNPYYYQGMQGYYYGQAPVQPNYYGQHQPRGYQNGRGPNHGYADQYNANGYIGADAFGGQFGNAGQGGNQGNKSGKDGNSQDQSAGVQQPQQQQYQQQYMGGAPYQAPAAGWGGYNQSGMYGMYPGSNPSGMPQQGGRDNNRGGYGNYNNRGSNNDANAQSGYSSWGAR